jgi:hypothetical protein
MLLGETGSDAVSPVFYKTQTVFPEGEETQNDKKVRMKNLNFAAHLNTSQQRKYYGIFTGFS